MSAAANESELWMVPFADLMSTLVILFMALYGMAALKQQAEKDKAQVRHQADLAITQQEKALAEAREKEAEMGAILEKAVRERLPKGTASVRVDAERVQLTLASPLLFESGSADLSAGIQPFLERIAEALKVLPNEILVEGHTDAAPIRGGPYPTNWDLSAARSFAVVDYLSQHGLPPARFSIYGYGEHRPIDDNATPEGRARNRRIEISLLRRTNENAPSDR